MASDGIPGLRRVAARRALNSVFTSVAGARPVEGMGAGGEGGEAEHRKRRCGGGGGKNASERHLLKSTSSSGVCVRG